MERPAKAGSGQPPRPGAGVIPVPTRAAAFFRILALGACLLLILCPARSQAMARMAIVLGCNIGLPDDKPLRYATRDAQQVFTALSQLGGVDKGRGYLLFDPEVSKVRAVFAEARTRIHASRAAGEKLQILIYFSGHGSQEALHINGERLPLEEIRAYFKEVEADLKLLIADACHSGSLIQPKGAVLAPPVPIRYQDELKVNGSAILTSSSAGELSQESQELKGSLFTHYFLSALRGAADFDRDGQITLWEAYNHAQSGLRRRLAAVKEIAQTPGFDVDIQGSDNVVLTRLDKGQAYLELKGLPEGEYRVLEAAGGAPFAELSLVGPEGATLALPRAAYLVFRPRGPGASASAGTAGYADLRHSARVSLTAGDFSPVDPVRWAAKGEGGLLALPRRGPAPPPLQVSLRSRLYAGFPGSASGVPAAEADLHGAMGPWSLLAGAGWLPRTRFGSPGSAVDLEGYSVSGEIRYTWSYLSPMSAFLGPRLELWTLDQSLNGSPYGKSGTARLLGSFAALGLERDLPVAMRLAFSLEAGWFWRYDADGALRRAPAFPMSLSLRFGL